MLTIYLLLKILLIFFLNKIKIAIVFEILKKILQF